VNKIDSIEAELQTLSLEELQQVREWLEDFVEDRLSFTPEFEAAIRESEQEMAAGRGRACGSPDFCNERGPSDILHPVRRSIL